MNKYKKIYDQIIEKYQNITIDDSIYCEVHHIIPLSLGGSDDKTNLVKLPYRVHVVAHECLYLYYRQIGDKISAAKMACAVHAMYSHDEHGKRKIFRSRLAEHFKLISNKAKKELLTQKYFEYNGEKYSIVDLSEISGVNKATLYERLVRQNLLDRYTMEELLAPKVIVKPKFSQEEKQKIGYEKFKPLFDLYLEKGGGREGYTVVCEKYGYDTNYCNLRRMFNKYIPEYKEYRQKCIDNQFHVEYNGQMMTPFEISKLTGVKKSVICSRLEDGWDIYEAVNTPVGFESDYNYRRSELSCQFNYWKENGFSGFNDKFNTAYKNEECVTSLFRKYFKCDYDEIIRDRQIVLTVDGKSYTIRELAEKTGNTIATCRERIHRGCSIEEVMKPGKLIDANSPEYIEKMRKILIPYFESYNRRGLAEVRKDFPECEYSGSSLRAMFNKYIPDLYKPENNGAGLRRKMGEPITIDGATKAIGEWAREYGLPVWKIRQRLGSGVVGKDLLKKESLNANIIEYGGKTYEGYAQLAREFGMDRSTLLNRLKRGMALGEALEKPVQRK